MKSIISASETRYRRLFESARDGILIIDAGTGRIEDANPFLTELLGFSSGELFGKNLFEIGLLADTVENRDAFVKLQEEEGYIRYGDLPLETRDGRPVHAEFVGNSYRVDGRMVVQCNIRDITARITIEEALSKERGQLRLLLDVCRTQDINAKDITAFVLGECIRICESELGFFGFLNEDETILTVDLWMGSAIEGCEVHQKSMEFPCTDAGIWAEAIRQRKPIIVNDYQQPDPRKKGYPEGHTQLVRLMSIPLIQGGKVVAVAAVANKRSHYGEADSLHMQIFLESVWGIIQRQRAVEDLQKSEERFRTVADFTYNWETWRDPKGKYLYISPACERASGYSPEEFMKDPGLLIRIAHPEDRARLVQHESEHETSDAIYNFDFRITTRSGEERWINHICQPVFDGKGAFIGRRASFRDITVQKRLETELAAHNRKLEELVKQRTVELEETNTALKVLLQRRETDKIEVEEKILSNVNELILPYLEKLKTVRLTTAQETCVNIIETNIQEILSPFLQHMRLAQRHLSPKETKIAALIRSGKSSKEIASILNVSNGTINFHRQNIRKKLGLADRSDNLESYLKTVTQY